MRKLLPGEKGDIASTPLAYDADTRKWVADKGDPKKAPRWRATVWIGTNDKPHQVKREGDTKAGAEKAVSRAATEWYDAQIEAGIQAVATEARLSQGPTLRRLIEVYMADPRNVRTGEPLRTNSLSNYQYGAKLLSESELADKTVPEIMPTALIALYNKVAVQDGHGTSAALAMRKVARAVMDGARADGLVDENPARVNLPGFPMRARARVGKDGHVHNTGVNHKLDITDEQVQRLLEGLRADPEAQPMASALDPTIRRKRTVNGAGGTGEKNGADLADFAAFVMYTGARKGELLALRWSDLDLDNATAQIDGTIVFVRPVRDESGKIVTPGRVERQPMPKTASSIREQFLIPELVEILRNRAEVFGIDLYDAPDTPVFGSPQKPTSWRAPSNMTDVVKRLFTRHGLPQSRTHAGRHYQVTLMHRENVPLADIAVAVGHNDIRTTMSYVNVSKKTSQVAREAMARRAAARPVR